MRSSTFRPLSLLVLGGTRFLGRAVVEAALADGHQVTLFNRGRTNPGLFPGVETVIGDRTGDLSALSHRRWDAVVDVAGYDPQVVGLSVDALRGGLPQDREGLSEQEEHRLLRTLTD
ncbi:NAD-dependent epimerase/dehydratase family protein [Kitasatospora sp. NPDC008050]|uniref:NAD-dependent epimerase/dehydratase family protein n=1 Tax=Kitasatospora sp. NPDC008050 TaxID=3364021 RepID=UPI0036E93CF0